MICHYWFFNDGFKFQDCVCNGCHDLTMLSVNISDIAIITVKNVDYHCIIYNISKSEGINSLKNYVLENRGTYEKYCPYKSVMNVYKSLNISIITLMKYPEMLKFIPERLEIKKSM